MKRNSLAALASIAVLVSACEKQATGQSVAVVNDEEISQAELNAELASANVPESADKKQVQAQLLQRVVDRRLLAQAAVEEGIDRSPEYISRQRRMNEDLLIGLMTKRRNDSIKLPSQTEIDRYISANPSMFNGREILGLEQIVFEVPRDRNLLSQLTGDRNLDAVAATLTRLKIPFQRSQGQLDTATVPQAIMRQINSLPPTEPFVLPAGGRLIASVIRSRQAAPLPPEQSRRLAVEAIRRQRLETLMDSRLTDLKRTAEISYQAGYSPPPRAKQKAAAVVN